MSEKFTGFDEIRITSLQKRESDIAAINNQK